MPGKQQSSTTSGKLLSKRKLPRQAPPPQWLELMSQVRRVRVAKGISSKEIATVFNTSVSVVAYWERGERVLHPHDLMVLLDELGLELVLQEKEKK